MVKFGAGVWGSWVWPPKKFLFFHAGPAGFSTGKCPFGGQQGPPFSVAETSIVYVFGQTYPWTCVCLILALILPVCIVKRRMLPFGRLSFPVFCLALYVPPVFLGFAVLCVVHLKDILFRCRISVGNRFTCVGYFRSHCF